MTFYHGQAGLNIIPDSRRKLWRVTVTAPAASAAAFSAVLEDGALALTIMQPPRRPDCTIEAIYAAAPGHAPVMMRLAVAGAVYGWQPPDFTIEPVPPEDWLRRVAAENPPQKIGVFAVHGRHDTGAIPFYTPRLMIEAATAFGTGAHPSTQLCLLLLQEHLRRFRPRRALDIGCGSGILALAAARLARCRTLAVDCDWESVRMTHMNAHVNGLQHYVQAVQGDSCRTRPVRCARPYDLVFANIFARPLMHMAKDVRYFLTPGGAVILSGLLHHQEAMVLAAYRMQRLHLARRLRIGEWAGLLLR